MEKYEGVVLENLRPATELDSSVPGNQKGAAGWIPEEPEDCGKEGHLASRYPQKRNAKFFRSMTTAAQDEGAQLPGKCSRLLVFSSFTW